MLLTNRVEATDTGPNDCPGPVRVAPQRFDPAGTIYRLIGRRRC